MMVNKDSQGKSHNWLIITLKTTVFVERGIDGMCHQYYCLIYTVLWPKGAQLQIFIHLFRGSLATETGLVGFNESI